MFLTLSEKYVYADNLALVQIVKNWQTLKGTFSQNMLILQAYLLKWKLNLSKFKTMPFAFHINNTESRT